MKKFVAMAFGFFVSLAAHADGTVLPAGSQPAAPSASPVAGSSAMFAQVVPFVLMFGVIYFLMIKPQQKKAKEQQNMLSSLKVGDEVLTASGILGRITDIADKVVSVEVANNVRIKMLKSQVSQVIQGGKV